MADTGDAAAKKKPRTAKQNLGWELTQPIPEKDAKKYVDAIQGLGFEERADFNKELAALFRKYSSGAPASSSSSSVASAPVVSASGGTTTAKSGCPYFKDRTGSKRKGKTVPVPSEDLSNIEKLELKFTKNGVEKIYNPTVSVVDGRLRFATPLADVPEELMNKQLFTNSTTAEGWSVKLKGVNIIALYKH